MCTRVTVSCIISLLCVPLCGVFPSFQLWLAALETRWLCDRNQNPLLEGWGKALQWPPKPVPLLRDEPVWLREGVTCLMSQAL